MTSSHLPSAYSMANPVYSYRTPSIHPAQLTAHPMEFNPVRVPTSSYPTLSSTSAKLPTVPQPSRRGRKSTVPPEQREQLRRLKKQNMERRRRACISDKMNALHSMAMNVIGIDPNAQQKIEKADILGICYTVLEGIAKIAQEKPELRSQLHSLRSYLPENPANSGVKHMDENSHSSTDSEEATEPEHYPRLVIDAASLDDKENEGLKSPVTCPNRGRSKDALTFSSQSCWHSTPQGNSPSFGITQRDSGFHGSMDEDHLNSTTKSSDSRIPPIVICPRTSDILQPVPLKSVQSSRRYVAPLRPTVFNTSANPNPERKTVRSTVKSAFRVVQPSPQTSTSSTVWRPYLDD